MKDYKLKQRNLRKRLVKKTRVFFFKNESIGAMFGFALHQTIVHTVCMVAVALVCRAQYASAIMPNAGLFSARFPGTGSGVPVTRGLPLRIGMGMMNFDAVRENLRGVITAASAGGSAAVLGGILLNAGKRKGEKNGFDFSALQR